MSEGYTPTESDLRQAYVESSGASMAQESYYAEQVAEFERGIARIKADAREALLSDEAVERAARAMDENFNPDRHPIMAAMFRDYAKTALTVAIGDDDE